MEDIGILFLDTNFWVLVAFTGFALLMYFAGRKSAMGNLDSYIDTVKTRIRDAEDLHAQAATLAKEYEARHEGALTEAKRIVDEAANEAAALVARGQTDLKERLELRQHQFDEELKQLKEQAAAELRAHMANLLKEFALQRLKGELTADAQNALVERSIETARASQQAA